jgi:hypothetical protein
MRIHGITQNQLVTSNTVVPIPGENPVGQAQYSAKTEEQIPSSPAARVSFSDRAMKGEEDEMPEMVFDKEALSRQMDSAKQAGNAIAGTFDVLRKCLIIASRIRNGDEVPDKDAKYLQENNPELYMQALMLRQQKENARKYESVLEDEKKSPDVSMNSRTHPPFSVESTAETAVLPSPEAVE